MSGNGPPCIMSSCFCMRRNLQKGMGNMDCSFCEEVRRIPAGDFMFYTEAVRQMGRIVRALKSGKNRWKVKQVRENEKIEKHKEKNCERLKSKRYIFAQHLE